MALYDSIGGGYGGASAQMLPHLQSLISKFGLEQVVHQPQSNYAPRTIINDLDEIFADLSSDQRKAIESDESYLAALSVLLQRFLFFLLSKTPEGTAFVQGPGRKLAQNLLDTTKKISANLDQLVKDNYKQMADRMAQLEAIIVEQNRQVKEQQEEIAKLQKQDESNNNTQGS